MINNPAPVSSQSWLDTKTQSFDTIVKVSNLPKKWGEFEFTQKKGLFRPVNRYVELFGNIPELKELSRDKVTLSYYTYGQIYLLLRSERSLYAMDRVWQRQFYPSNNDYDFDKSEFLSDDCFKFYVPWVIDADIDYQVFQGSSSAFSIIEKAGRFHKSFDDEIIYKTEFVDFFFNAEGEHMDEFDHSILDIGEHMYDISFVPTEDVYKDLEAFYAR